MCLQVACGENFQLLVYCLICMRYYQLLGIGDAPLGIFHAFTLCGID